MKYSLKALKKHIGELPEELEGAFLSVDPDEKLEEIREEYELHIDQGSELMEEVALLISGGTAPDELRHNIQKRLDVSKDTAKSITKDLNNKIFIPIKDALKEITARGKTQKDSGTQQKEDRGEEEMDRDKLLSEIENPPSSQPVYEKKGVDMEKEETSQEEAVEDKAVDDTKTKEDEQKQGEEKKDKLTEQIETGIDTYERKMKESTSSESKNQETTGQGDKEQQEKRRDPYREPIE